MPAKPSVPSTPSAPPKASVTMGSVAGVKITSPTAKESTRIVGTAILPVTPRNRTDREGSGVIPRISATWDVMAERLAPVSRTSRKGPLPLIVTGAQIRPIRSRRVGATKRGSGARTTISDKSSLGVPDRVTLAEMTDKVPSNILRHILGRLVLTTLMSGQGFVMAADEVLQQMRPCGIEVDDAKGLACSDAAIGHNVS